VVRAYLDASGQKNDPIVVVAGFLGFPGQFERFENLWDPFLKEFELDHFHATEFWARKSRPYVNWSNEQHLKAQGDICKILSDPGGPPCGIAAAVLVPAFNKWRETLDHYYPSDPYYFCLDEVLHTLVYSTGPGAEDITIYCDQEKEHELLGTDIARWHEARLNKTPSLATNPLDRPRNVSVLYGPKRKFIPLQLADILANDTYKMTFRFMNSGRMGQPFFTRCLTASKHQDRVATYFFSSVGIIDAIYKTRRRDTEIVTAQMPSGF
jgi:Protein of unknown function (DUF3800)